MKYKKYKLEDVLEAEKEDKFKVISMFCGGGGSSTGYRLAGGKVLLVNEFVEAARQAYAKNYRDTIILPDDIRKLSGKDLLDPIGLKVGELDILDGSFPCSSFSTVGLRQEAWGREKAYSDTKQRTDDLAFEFARIIKEVQPKFFVAENVVGLIMGQAKTLFGSAQTDLFGAHEDTIYHTLTKAGYKVRYKVLNAKNFGVPQSRERLFIVGVRNDIDFEYKFPIGNNEIVTLSEAFEGLELSEQDLKDCNIDRYAVGDELKRLKIGEQSEKYFSLNKADPKKPARTLTATASCLSAASVAHWDNRKFATKEAIRIQSFPDDYYLGETYTNQIERLGRSVPPFLMREIAKGFKY